MTKRREPLTYQHTLEMVATAIGWERAGALCGVTGRAVRNWSDHDCEQEIRMIDAERLDRAFMEQGGTYAPFHRLLSLRLEIASRETESRDLATHAATAAKESGEAIAAMIAVSGNLDDPTARREARRELQQAIDAMTDGIAALEEETDR
ncbi:MAG: hypothetical protein CVT77_09530 [Alphaproteobacteria bacterium HGW-Alphaproteobacteria-16]|nr:MAG: hypothetical protein CVT77_09530 [Alphaproteobacteria bacterium HGW-Alphaproteobacteria-16]